MDSLSPYHLPAIIFALLGVSVLLFGCWGAYRAVPDGPKHHYSVSEADEVPSHSEVMQFTDLSETGQEIFLRALNEGDFDTNKEASEIDYVTDVSVKNYVEYQNQVYVFVGLFNYSGWWKLGVIFFGGVAFVGLITILIGCWFVKANYFKLPTAALSGVLAATLLRVIIESGVIVPPRVGYNATIVALTLLPVPILTWCALKRIEYHWNLSFSQRMEH